MMDSFEQAKTHIVANLRSLQNDRSPKGSVDSPILTLIDDINSRCPDLVTTSSCSGRVSLFHGGYEELEDRLDDAQLEDGQHVPKKGTGKWLGVNHDRAWTLQELKEMVSSVRDGNVVFKHEPFVMHVLCRNIEAARELLRVAVESGFRESGISHGTKKLIVGIRTWANAMEVPVVHDGKLLMDDAGLEAIAEIAQVKFDHNLKRRERLHENILNKIVQRSSVVFPRKLSATPQIENNKYMMEWKLMAGVSDQDYLKRWGHTATVLPGGRRILIHGGYGVGSFPGSGCHQRLNDLILLEQSEDGETWTVDSLNLSYEDPRLVPGPCMKHSANLVCDHVVLFFGGRSSPYDPSKDVFALDVARWSWLDVDVNELGEIESRWAHSATTIGTNLIYVFGGRGEDHLLNDLLSIQVQMDEQSKTVRVAIEKVDVKGSIPPARFAHSASVMQGGSSLVVYGGYGDLTISTEQDTPSLQKLILGDIHVLDIVTSTWSCILANDPEFGRFSHHTVTLGTDATKMLVFGGVTHDYIDNMPRIFDIVSKQWTMVPSSCTYGQAPHAVMMQKSTLLRLGNTLVGIGGGALCFSFGFYSSPAWYSDISWLVNQSQAMDEPNALVTQNRAVKKWKTILEKAGLYDKTRRIGPYQVTGMERFMAIPFVRGETERVVELLRESQTGGKDNARLVFAFTPLQKVSNQPHQMKNNKNKNTPSKPKKKAVTTSPIVEGNAVLVVPAKCKLLKNALEQAGLYDKTRLAGKVEKDGTQPSYLALPIVKCQGNVKGELENIFESLGIDMNITNMELVQSKKNHQKRGKSKDDDGRPVGLKQDLLETIEALVAEVPKLKSLLNDKETLLKEIPTRIEVLSDVAIIPCHAFATKSLWDPLTSLTSEKDDFNLWEEIARLSGTKRVLKQETIDPSCEKRSSRARFVFPAECPSTKVKTKQNGVIYSFDMEKCMFSSGNISEKLRVANFPCKGETVVDMFAGIGYFTLPYLVKTGASMVHACEWNPDALTALAENLELNKVQDRCIVYPGDCRETIETKLKGVADRVNMGILPSSQPFLRTGVTALKPSTGGWLHIHENVARKDQEQWKADLVRELTTLCEEILGGGPWSVSCPHLERVKSFSPRVDHVVADVHCIPLKGVVPPTPPASTSPLKAIERSDGALQVPYPQTREESASVLPLFELNRPIVFTDVLPSETKNLWSVASLSEPSDLAELQVSVHMADPDTDGKISFVHKSFKFKVMSFKELLDIVKAEKEFCYLRAVGNNPRKDRAHFWEDYQVVADHCKFEFPSHLIDPKAQYHSSVFRVASKGLQLWTHYDVMHNILYQMHGSKRMVLFPPHTVGALRFQGSSSSIVDIDDKEGNSPEFVKARKEALDIMLEPGQALFIPALWPHNARADESSIALNIFWKHLSDAHYSRKDLYGNRDPILAEKAMELVSQAKQTLRGTAEDGTKLPQPYVDFYARVSAANLVDQQ